VTALLKELSENNFQHCFQTWHGLLSACTKSEGRYGYFEVATLKQLVEIFLQISRVICQAAYVLNVSIKI
jgi:hypothetical protein